MYENFSKLFKLAKLRGDARVISYGVLMSDHAKNIYAYFYLKLGLDLQNSFLFSSDFLFWINALTCSIFCYFS